MSVMSKKFSAEVSLKTVALIPLMTFVVRGQWKRACL